MCLKLLLDVFDTNVYCRLKYILPRQFWLRVRRSNFMRSKFTFSWDQISWDQNSLFHEIKFMRSNFSAVFMRSKFLIIIQSPDRGIFHEIKIQKSIISNFHLIIDLLVLSTIMRSKFKINYSNLVSCTCGKFLALIISHLCLKTFDLMIALAANKLIMRSKLPNNALFWISISWSIC